MRFKDLGLIEPIQRALEDKKYNEPTQIQREAIPAIIARKDILATAQTGTGKTAAFAVPIIQLIHRREKKQPKRTLRSLIITPTRELALQIGMNIKQYAKYTSVKHAVIFGGVKPHEQERQLRKGVHILVATPGRLLDFMGQGLISLDTIKLLVLDEADRMLDMGFIHDIRKILQNIPREKQTLLFSATMPSSISDLAAKLLVDPVRIAVDPVSSAAEAIQQSVYFTNRKDKVKLLEHVLRDQDMDQVLLFTRTKHGADRLVKKMGRQRIHAIAIHGNKSQGQRQKALELFKSGKVRLLVATDIAARGIDVKNLKYVINYDLPNIPETYVHRIGRSGRAGEEGFAIALCEADEISYIKGIEKLTGEKLTVVKDHPFPQTDQPMTDQQKKAFEKEKISRRKAFHANRKKNKGSRRYAR